MSEAIQNHRATEAAAPASGQAPSETASPPASKPAAAAILWCCHIRGPDEVHAAPDYEAALAWSDMINALNWRGGGGKIVPPPTYDECLLKAAPAIWPWSAESHAEQLARSIADFKVPAHG